MRWTGAVYSTYSSLYVLRDFYLLCFYSFWDGLVLTTLLFIGIFHSCLFFIYGGIFTDCIWSVQSARWAGAVYILFSLCVTRFLQIVLFQLLRWATYLPFYFIGIFPSGHFFIYGGIFPDLTCFVQPPRWAGAVHPHDGDSEPGAAHPGPGHRGLPLLLLQQRLWTGPTTDLCLLRDEVGCCLLIF